MSDTTARPPAVLTEDEPDEDPVTSTPPGSPARALAVRVIEWARADLAAAGTRRAEATATHAKYHDENPKDGPGDADLYRWVDALVSAEADARDRLAASVLMLFGRIEECADLFELPSEGWPPVALDLNDEVIVVMASEGHSRPVVVIVPRD